VEIGQTQRGAANRNEPQPYCDFWLRHGPTKLLQSSMHRGWSGLSVELRAHGKGVVPWRGTQSDTEICVDISGDGSIVTRRASGIIDRTVGRRDTVWLCPAGWREGSIDIADDQPEIMHIYLPPSQFSPSKLGSSVDNLPLGALRFESAFEDPLLGEMARALALELRAETSAGRLLVDSLANSMAARLVQKYISVSAAQSAAFPATGGLNRRRLFRVLDYIEANLEGDLTLDHMASIACLSRFHFARAFKQAVGQSPHRYVSARRLERAKALLIQGDRPLVDIALALSFSSQANFTRAFRQATGQAPGQYRQQPGSRSPESSLDVSRGLSTSA
jgi:AraC family transcriptional regulator